jgi:hypothetical protein
MGGATSRRKKNEDALAVVASPGTSTSPLPMMTAHSSSSPPMDLNTSLNETQTLLAEDAEWLDESEMIAMEDEDAKMVRELSATESGEVSLEEWIRSRDADVRMSVRIINVVTQAKFMGRKTVEYTIETGTGTVRRRYRDFVALRYGLENRFPGAVVPPLPAKRRIGKTDPTFVVKRKRLLQLFLQSLARHPFLSGDELFVEFIASAARFDRRSAWRQRAYLVKAQKWSIAARRWAQALILAETPQNPQATMEAALLELAAVQKHLGGLKTAVKLISHRAALYSTSILEVGGAFQRSQVQEAQLVLFSGAVGEVETPPQDRTTVTQVCGYGQQLSAQNAEVMQQTPDLMDEAMLCPLRYEMSFVETFAEALRRTKFSIVRHRQSVTVYRSAREQSEIGSFRTTSVAIAVPAEVPTGSSTQPEHARLIASSSEAEKSRQRLQKLRLAAVQAQMAARRDINGILALELQRFRIERAARLALAFDSYSRVQRGQAEKIEAIWRTANFPPISPVATVSQSLASSNFTIPSSTRSVAVPPPVPPPESEPDYPAESDTAAGHSEHDQYNQAQAQNDPNASQERSLVSRRSSQLRAKYPFQGEHEDELDVDAGDVLVGAQDELNPDWVRAKSLTTGKEGLVPKTYVEEIDDPDLSSITNQGEDEDEEYDSQDEHSRSDSNNNGAVATSPTNYIKQTQDMFNKGTKRSNDAREKM